MASLISLTVIQLPAAAGHRATHLLRTTFAESIPDVTQAPYRAVGVVTVELGDGSEDTCSGTAIDSPSRQLVLTAGHCLYEKQCAHCPAMVARRAYFTPAFDHGSEPYGTFVAQSWRVPPRWHREWFDDSYDVGAMRMYPNELGQNVADLVGGGIPIALDQPRRRTYEVLGYPGEPSQLFRCRAGFFRLELVAQTSPVPGPFAINCYLGDGASGGPWLIEGGSRVAGIVSYSVGRDRSHIYSPYFSGALIRPLVAGL